MKKINLLLVISFLFAVSVFAQKGKVNTALFSFQEGKTLEAKQQIDEAMKDPEAQTMAKSWMVKGDIYKGLYLDITLYPQNPNALFEATDAYMKAYDLETNPKKKNDVTLPLKDVSNALKNEAVSAYQNGKYDAAYKQFSNAMKINKFVMDKGISKDLDTFAIYGTAIAAFNSDMLVEAQPLLEKLVEVNFENEAPYVYLANIYDSKKDPRLVALLEKALAKYPDNTNLRNIDLNYNIDNNNIEQTIKKLEEALKKDPNNASMLYNMGYMYDQLNKGKEAITFYDDAIKFKPDYAAAYSNAGAVYFNKAVAINLIINREDKNSVDSFLVKLGKQDLFTIAEVDAALKEKNYSNLLSSFANVTDEVAFKEKVAKINEMIKYDLLQGSRNVLYSKALPYLEKSFKFDPTSKGIRAALKEIYARMNMLDKAASLNEQ